jgi:hypothetical protein
MMFVLAFNCFEVLKAIRTIHTELMALTSLGVSPHVQNEILHAAARVEDPLAPGLPRIDVVKGSSAHLLSFLNNLEKDDMYKYVYLKDF